MQIRVGLKYKRIRGPHGDKIFTCVDIIRARGRYMVYLEGDRDYKIRKSELNLWFTLHKKVVKLKWK